jgi:methylglutaconyl-CoA hydratase
VYHTIVLDMLGKTATVTLNRPDVRNAFNALMIGELTDAFERIGRERRLRVIVLGGAGKSFCGGADIAWMKSSLDLSEAENVSDAERMSDMFYAINHCPCPVVGRVQGAALGGGMGLLAVCDIVVAEEGATFGFTEAKLGIIPAVISRFVYPKIGETWARALFLTAERFGVDVAHRIGLVHWIAVPNELDDVVNQKVSEIVSSGPVASREAKELISELAGSQRDEWRNLTSRRIARLRTSAEGQEGLRAFLEKRIPSWLDDVTTS